MIRNAVRNRRRWCSSRRSFGLVAALLALFAVRAEAQTNFFIILENESDVWVDIVIERKNDAGEWRRQKGELVGPSSSHEFKFGSKDCNGTKLRKVRLFQKGSDVPEYEAIVKMTRSKVNGACGRFISYNWIHHNVSKGYQLEEDRGAPTYKNLTYTYSKR